MRGEIAEQPARWKDLLAEQGGRLKRLRDRILARPPRLVLFVARGTSDHGVFYANYLVQTSLGLPAASASPSVVTLYDARLSLDDVLVVAVSQSGESPDLIAFAVAATKTYTAELLALAALFAADPVRDQRPRLPDLGERVGWSCGPSVARLAAGYRYATRVVTAARGYSSASAREAALKLMETAYLSSHGMSAADRLHGPVAMLDESVPLLCFPSAGRTLPPLLPEVAPELRPLLEIIPAQLLAAELALARGSDPDSPRGLSKVTRTY